VLGMFGCLHLCQPKCVGQKNNVRLSRVMVVCIFCFKLECLVKNLHNMVMVDLQRALLEALHSQAEGTVDSAVS
jgi:hypothetical protein